MNVPKDKMNSAHVPGAAAALTGKIILGIWRARVSVLLPLKLGRPASFPSEIPANVYSFGK